MPCAAGELCQLSNQTPVAPHGHPCRGGCGGRLHDICGEMAVQGEGEEMHRICHACLSSKQASTAAAGKRKAQDAGGILKRANAGEGKKAGRTAPRTRLTLAQKTEVLADLDKKATQESRRQVQVRCDNFRTVRGREVEQRKQNEPSTGLCTHSLLVRSEYEHVMNQVRYSSTVLYRRVTRVQDADTVLYCIHGCNMLSSSHHNRRSLLSVSATHPTPYLPSYTSL